MPDHPRSPKETKLEELVRQGERVLDFQIRSAEEHNKKSEQGITVAIVVIAASTGLANLALGDRALDGSFLAVVVLLVLALFFAGAAAWFFAASYVGLGNSKNTYTIGWSASVLQQTGADERYGVEDVHAATLTGFARWIPRNNATLMGSARKKAHGARFLLASAFTVGVAFLYALFL